MRVRLLSGHFAGTIQDLPRVEAEVAIQTGYAALMPPEVALEPAEPLPIDPAAAALTPEPPPGV